MSDDLRFAFGKNWRSFLDELNEQRIKEAEQSLAEKLSTDDLSGKTFLDAGCGSGLFSLAAHRMGAKVFSFDYDEDCVNCAKYLREKYTNNDKKWQVTQGSVLDKPFLATLGKFDIVYSWGVLHHTGDMYRAFANIHPLVKKKGSLFISIYNDQGTTSKIWTKVKKMYNDGGDGMRLFLTIASLIRLWLLTFIKDLFKSGNPMKTWANYKDSNRGMSAWHDVVDWVGGYPFEVAKPEEVFDFFADKELTLDKLATCGGGLGCNEFVFVRN